MLAGEILRAEDGDDEDDEGGENGDGDGDGDNEGDNGRDGNKKRLKEEVERVMRASFPRGERWRSSGSGIGAMRV